MTKLKWISLYQLIVWGVAFVQYAMLFGKGLNDHTSLIWVGMGSFLIALSVFSLHSNICLLFDLHKTKSAFFLDYNIVLNLLQLIYIKVLGLKFLMEFGVYFLVYIDFSSQSAIGVHPSFFESGLTIKYTSNDDSVRLGVNLVALILLLALLKIRRK